MAEINNSTINSLRDVAQQTGFAKKIFTQGIDGISAQALTAEFRALLKMVGIELPQQAVVTIDVVQLVIAGGALAQDVNDAVDVGEEVGDIICETVGDIANVGLALAHLLKDLGVGGEPLKQATDFITLGVSLALVVSSCGTNILADISAIMATIAVICDLEKDFFGSHDEAVADAKKKLAAAMKAAVTGYTQPQVEYAVAQMRSFQTGQLDYFDFVGNIATHSPLEFKSFFPNLACYFPSWRTVTISATVTGVSEGWFGSQTDVKSASVSFEELFASHRQIESVLFNYFVGSPTRAFREFFQISQGISLEAISVIAMILSSGMTGAVEITQDFDILAACQALGVTPFVLGDDWLFKGFDKNEYNNPAWKQLLPYPPLTIPYTPFQGSGVVVNGQPYYTQKEKVLKAGHDELIGFQLYLQELDRKGDIDTLMKIPEAVAILKKWATFHPKHVLGPGLNNPYDQFDSSLGPPINPVDPKADIKISDYWKCLGIIKKMRASSLFADQETALAHYGDIDALSARVKHVQSIVYAKAINQNARRNIAKALGCPPESLGSRLTKRGTRVFYRKAG